MSTEQSVDPQMIEMAKQHIRGLVAEIAQLARQDVTEREFFGEYLNRVVTALAAAGGAVWMPNEAGVLELEFQIALRDTRLGENQQELVQHGRMLHHVITQGEPAMVPPHSGTGDEQGGGNPTDFLLLLGPIKVESQVKRVVEIFQRPIAQTKTQRGYLKFLIETCELASDFLRNRQLRHLSDRQSLWTQLEQFTRLAHHSLNSRDIAYTIANEGRRLIECDRVSVAMCRGSKARIEAVSGQDTFDRRSNTIYLLNQLATAVVRADEPLWFTGDTTDLAPQVETAVQAYVDDAHSKQVIVLPLKPPAPEDEEQPKHKAPIGALIVELIEDVRPREGRNHRIQVVADHSATALANAIEHESLFLMPVWRTLGRASWLVTGRTLPKTVAAVVAAVALLVAASVVPADFKLQARGTLQPVIRRDVFAPLDGTVDEVLTVHGQLVDEGQLLAVLRNTDLAVARSDVEGRRFTTIEELRTTQRALSLLTSNAGGLDESEKNRLSGQSLQLQQRLKALDAQLALYDRKIDELRVTSPIRGEVTTWNVAETLIQRPVRQGQILMNVADPSGEWELELHVPEDRMGHIERARSAVQAADPDGRLRVTYILATDPSTEHEGTVREMHINAEIRGDEGNTVQVDVEIDKRDLAHLQPGADVTAKIHCGRRAIGYVWLHDLFSWLHRVWFRIT